MFFIFSQQFLSNPHLSHTLVNSTAVLLVYRTDHTLHAPAHHNTTPCLDDPTPPQVLTHTTHCIQMFAKKEQKGPSLLEILQEAEEGKQKMREVELNFAKQRWIDQQVQDLVNEKARLKKSAKKWRIKEQKRVDKALWHAARIGVLSQVESLVIDGGAIDGAYRDGDNWSASEVAEEEGFTHIVEWFELGKRSARTAKRWARSEQKELDEELYQACRDSNFEEANVLIAEGAFPDGHQNFWGVTALHKSTLRKKKGGIPTMQLLLQAGANVNQVDGKDGSTCLHKAAEKGWATKVEWLLLHGANINALDHKFETALHRATDHGYTTTVKLLVNHGADIKIKNRTQRDAANIATVRQHTDIVDFLTGVPWNIAETRADRRLIFQQAMKEAEKVLSDKKEEKRLARAETNARVLMESRSEKKKKSRSKSKK